ncbi:MAG: type II secretion system minor pseudopilin GspK [Candidatus Sedimenticola sp. (ex Thyasira tokunagai)]
MNNWAGKPPPSSARGVALLTVLLVVAIATIAAVAMATRQQVDIRKTENLLRMEQAWQFAYGIDSWAKGRLIEDRKENDTDSSQDIWNTPIAPTDVEGGALSANIEELQGRFNLNNLIKEGKPSEVDLARFRRLLTQLGQRPELAEALLDWIDPDMNVRYPGGAEDGMYLNRQPPYRSANRPLTDVNEMMLIEGFDAEVVSALQPHVTALPEYTPINVNSAGTEVLMSLAEGLTSDNAEALAADREEAPFTGIEPFLGHPSFAGREISTDGLGFACNYFQINGDVHIGRIQLRYASTLHRPKEGDLHIFKRKRKGVFDE